MSKSKKNKRDDFISLIPADAKKILDLGCADGSTSGRLKDKGLEVVGVEKDPDLCELARSRLDRVFKGDIADLKLPYSPGYFDCIVYGDVLDCLVDPLAVLKKNSVYLKPGGFVIASMANIRYYKIIIRMLFAGTWDYVDEGILWKHHLRFFTLINMRELFWNAGFEITRLVRNITAARGFRIADCILLHGLQDLLTYQYYLQARKTSEFSALPRPKRKIYSF